MPETEVTILGTSFLEPILLLWRKLNESNFSGYSEIRKSMNENGYSCSIISLCVFCIESFITRMRYIDDANLSERKDALKYFRSKFPSEGIFNEDLTELFVLRNLIAHNHLWKINYDFDANYNEINISRNTYEGWGNNDFNNNIILDDCQTKRLKLEIIPTKIGKEDVKKVLITLKEFLDFIVSKDNRYCSEALYSELKNVVDELN